MMSTESNIVTRTVVEHIPTSDHVDSESPSPTRLVPFDTLPTDIIVKIFVSACPMVVFPGQRRATETGRRNVEADLEDPLILSMVSKRWREITITHPSMWATLVIHCSRIDKKEWDEWGALKLREFLGRSGSHPLKIRVNASENDEAVISGILDSLILHSERWKSVTFDFPMAQEFWRKLDLLEGPMPLLESFNFNPSSSLDMGMTVERGKFLSSSSLKRIGFGPYTIPQSILQHITWANISEVVFNGTAFRNEQDFRGILECISVSAIALTFLRISVDSLREDVVESGTLRPVRLEKLQKLRMTGFPGLLDAFICPSLDNLEIYDGDGNEDEIARFLEKSACNLTNIHICDIQPSHADPRKYYTIFQSPSLSTLKSISLEELTESNVDLLNFIPHKLFPALESLRVNMTYRVRGDGGQHLSAIIEGLQRVVWFRTRPPPPNGDKSSMSEAVAQQFRDDALLSSLKTCYFTFRLKAGGPESDSDVFLAEMVLDILQVFCSIEKVRIQQEVVVVRESNASNAEIDEDYHQFHQQRGILDSLLTYVL